MLKHYLKLMLLFHSCHPISGEKPSMFDNFFLVKGLLGLQALLLYRKLLD